MPSFTFEGYAAENVCHISSFTTGASNKRFQFVSFAYPKVLRCFSKDCYPYILQLKRYWNISQQFRCNFLMLDEYNLVATVTLFTVKVRNSTETFTNECWLQVLVLQDRQDLLRNHWHEQTATTPYEQIWHFISNIVKVTFLTDGLDCAG